MLCGKPFKYNDTVFFPCGDCDACRSRRRALWSHRIMLESLKHNHNSFLTLTYDEAHLPADGSLVIKHYQDFLKRLRKAIEPIKLRYYFVGEYGDLSWRPHYHAALFGIGRDFVEVVSRCWPYGFSMLGELTPASANYVAGYVTKKITNASDKRLDGRHPEFARMSLRPGIGATAMEDVANVLFSRHGWDSISDTGDVPTRLTSDRQSKPLGRYLRTKLRQYMGFVNHGAPEGTLLKLSAEMSELFETARLSPKLSQASSNEALLAHINAPKLLRRRTRSKIFSQSKKL